MFLWDGNFFCISDFKVKGKLFRFKIRFGLKKIIMWKWYIYILLNI